MASAFNMTIFKMEFSENELRKDYQLELLNFANCNQHHETCVIKTITVFSSSPFSKTSIAMIKPLHRILCKTVSLIHAVQHHWHFYNKEQSEDSNTNKSLKDHLDKAHKEYMETIAATKLYASTTSAFPEGFREKFYPPAADLFLAKFKKGPSKLETTITKK